MFPSSNNIGIKAIEIYFPNQAVQQVDLEKFDGVSEGKYTIGLGQTCMSFCDDREDIYSLALTAVSSLLRKWSIDPTTIGRLEVGTETILDKSKSVKSVLMQLFEPYGNTNIEGVDTINACYGGTSALFNAINWLESSAWDGRDAIVVAGDIALYSKGNARPTGGAGCVALMLGQNAPLVFDRGLRGSHISHTYDFYKPDLSSEYPIVDGLYSIRCYLDAIDKCYAAYNHRENTLKSHMNGVSDHDHNDKSPPAAVHETPLDRFDYMCFHSPTTKLVRKSYARLLYNDYINDSTPTVFSTVPDQIKTIEKQCTLSDKTIENTFVALSGKRYEQRVKPCAHVPTMCGNMYSASLYSSLCSLIARVPTNKLVGKRVGFFSFGSGLASSMFSLKVDSSAASELDQFKAKLDLENRLQSRAIVSPEKYEEMCVLREKIHLQKSVSPIGDVDVLAANTYYLTDIDDQYRRTYKVKT